MTPADLVAHVAVEFEVARDELVGWSRRRPLARARFAFCWSARRLDGCSYRVIGNVISGRNHTSIIHAVARAEDLRASDPDFRERTDRLLAQVHSEDGNG